MPIDQLDIGFSLELKRMMEAAGATECAQVSYLLSDAVQRALETTFRASAASSLPVERAFAQTKRNEAPRLCHVSVASRSQILRTFLRERREMLDRVRRADRAVARAMKVNVTYLAWAHCRGAVGRPRGARAIGEEAPSSLEKAHDAELIRRYIEEHRLSLEAEIAERRSTARAHRESLRSTGTLVTEAEWLGWFTDNSDAFRQRMVTAAAERSALSRRMRASPDIPKNAARLEASCAPPALSAESKPEWLKLLQGRDGWFCVRSNPRQVQTLFLFSRGYQTYFLSVDRFRRGQRFVVPGDVSAFRVAAAVHPLQSLVIDGDFDSCVELVSEAIAHDGHVSLGFSFAQRVAAPLPRSARTAPSAGATKELAAESDSDADSLAEELEADAAGDAKGGMSDSSGCFSVDTDVDACVSEFLKRLGTDVDGVDASSDSDGAAAPSAEVAPSAGLTRPEGRRPPGTWAIWESVWFYITQSPTRYLDLKVHMKQPYRYPLGYGMGWRKTWTKTLSPHHYGETLLNPQRTTCLLRSWTIWRARLGGWAREQDTRLREIEHQVERLVRDVANLTTDPACVLGDPHAARLIHEWTPDVVAQVRAGM